MVQPSIALSGWGTFAFPLELIYTRSEMALGPFPCADNDRGRLLMELVYHVTFD